MSLKTGNLLQISGWARGVASFRHRASQQASGARQWAAWLGAVLLLANPLPTLSAVLGVCRPAKDGGGTTNPRTMRIPCRPARKHPPLVRPPS